MKLGHKITQPSVEWAAPISGNRGDSLRHHHHVGSLHDGAAAVEHEHAVIGAVEKFEHHEYCKHRVYKDYLPAEISKPPVLTGW